MELKNELLSYIKANQSHFINASINAGKEIKLVRKSSFKVETKNDKSPVTLADIKSNEIIQKSLNLFLFKNNTIPVMSEEEQSIPYHMRKYWDYYWCIDPLDGTKEFINGRDSYTTNIGLIYKGEPIAGFVYLPEKDVIYCGIEGYPAFKIINASVEPVKLSISPNSEVKKHLNIVASLSHLNTDTENLINCLKQSYSEVKLIQAGSSLKFCFIADGTADFYPRLAPTMEWDTAAADAVCRAAGCFVLNVDTMKPLKYNKENLKNPGILTFGNDQIVKNLSNYYEDL
ncbi:MAG: 3'(2'),5'-bisphosphate nucleotidase CysQ [Spirochaetales bacterium]|nr:3'(2'),5'-bisphosphate nucleotidase CysQ [Spirochaetales bacterium]